MLKFDLLMCSRIYFIYISERYLIVMQPALCAVGYAGGYGERRNRIQYRDQRAQTVRRSSGLPLTHCVCQVSLAELYNFIDYSAAVVCEYEMCTAPGLCRCAVTRFSDLLIAQIRQRRGHNL